MDEIRYWIEAEGSGHYFFIAFPVCLLILFILLRSRRLRFVVPGLLMSLVIVNPLFYRYWDALDLYAYWRMLWVVPVVSVVAGVVPAITEKTRETGVKANIVVVGVALIAFGGTFLYSGAGGAFTFPASNAVKLPEYVIEVAEYLEALEDSPRAVVQYPIGTYLRQYTGDIDIMYGRNIDGYIQRASKEAQTVHSQLIDPEGDLELVATILANEGFDYLVLDDTDRMDDLWEEDFQLLDRVAGYGVYKVHETPDAIKERNRLGQVVSVTTVDSEGRPVNGDGGYSKTAYVYDSYGNVIREFRTNVEGYGVANNNGFAGCERAYDRLGNVVMERNIGLNGEPINNSAGYAEVRRAYRGKNMVSESYFDDQGMQVNRIDTLYASVKFNYDGKHHRISERYYDADDLPVNSSSGYAHIIRSYDGNYLISEAYFDSDGKPAATEKGYAAIARTYDSRGRMLSESYLGADNEPVDCINGYATLFQEYDGDDNVVRQRFEDAGSTPVITAAGYAEVRREYSDKKVIREAYFDGEGNPLRQAAGYVAIAQEWDGDVLVSRTYLDDEGNPMLRADGYAKAIWAQDGNGTWNIRLEDLAGMKVPLEGRNLARDIRIGQDGWSEWMTPNPNILNCTFNIGTVNLGPKQDGDVYTSQIEIEFRNVTATPNQEFHNWTQGAQDNRWFTGNPWNGNLVNLYEPPGDGVYKFESAVAVSGDMANVSTFNLGFRCDYWESGSFRVRNVKVEKGDTRGEWSPGV